MACKSDALIFDIGTEALKSYGAYLSGDDIRTRPDIFKWPNHSIEQSIALRIDALKKTVNKIIDRNFVGSLFANMNQANRYEGRVFEARAHAAEAMVEALLLYYPDCPQYNLILNQAIYGSVVTKSDVVSERVGKDRMLRVLASVMKHSQRDVVTGIYATIADQFAEHSGHYETESAISYYGRLHAAAEDVFSESERGYNLEAALQFFSHHAHHESKCLAMLSSQRRGVFAQR